MRSKQDNKKSKIGNVIAVLLSILVLIIAIFSIGCAPETPEDPDSPPSGSGGHVHEYTQAVVQPTCLQSGYTLYSCKKCDYEYTGDIVPAKGHDYETSVVNPTCKQGGYDFHDCKNCDSSYKDNPTSVVDHSFGAFVSNKDAEYRIDGTKTRRCIYDGCNVSETVTDPGSALKPFTFDDGIPIENGVTISGPSGKVGVIEHNDNKCVQILDTSTSDISILEVDFKTITKDELISFKVMILENGTCTMALTSDEDTKVPEVSLVARPTGKLSYFNGSNEINIKDITLNAWIVVDIYVNAQSSTFDLVVDGQVVDNDIEFRNGGKTLTGMRIGTTKSLYGSMQVDDLYIPDSIKIKPTPNLPQASTPSQGEYTHKESQILFNGEGDSLTSYQYLSFPTLLKLSDERVIALYRRGPTHYLCHGIIEMITYNPKTEQVISRTEFYNQSTINAQNPELVKMPNGDIVCYLDTQKPSGSSTVRYGIKQFRSTDNGLSWVETDGLVDDLGIEYGYTFDDAIIGNDIYMIVMTFPELEDKGHGRSVHMIKSSDNGSSWTHLKDLNDEFGFSFNESSIEVYQDGFFMVLRGDDNITRAFITDIDCNLIVWRSLSSEYDCIANIGRPKLFIENGNYYLMCRNVLSSTSAELALYKLKVDTIEIVEHTQLDLASVNYTRDTYYAEYYMQSKNDELYFNVITYRPSSKSGDPNIIRLEYKWNEIG